MDEQALLTAMAHVDLNPIRAGMAKELAESEKTSVKQRLQEMPQTSTNQTTVPLLEFAGFENKMNTGLPFNLQDYLHLVDWTGRCVRDDKRRKINESVPAILTRLGISEDEWLPTVTTMQARFEAVMGAPQKMKAHAQARGGCFYRGYRHALKLYRQLSV